MPSSQARKEEIDRQFRDFHSLNPHVYKELVTLAHKAKSHGSSKIGIEYIFNVARWELMLKTKNDSDTFKLNNNYKSRYSRLIMENEKELDGFFTTREARVS